MLTLQSFDFIWLSFILWGCRPRKEWPAFFTLSINEFAPGQQGGDGQRAAALPPSMSTAPINDTLMSEDYDMEKRCDSIGSNDAVIIINPTKYTLEYDDLDYNSATGGDKSAFDPDMIVAEDEEAEQQEAMKQLQEMKHRLKVGEEEVDRATVQSELVLGFRDQKQVRKLKKEKERKLAQPRKSVLQRLFNRSSTKTSVKPKPNSAAESPLIDSKAQSDDSSSSEGEQQSPLSNNNRSLR